MFNRWFRCATSAVAFGVLCLVLPGGVQVTAAAKKCVFNGQRFSSGDMVFKVSQACTTFSCLPKLKKNGKVSKKQVEIATSGDSLDSCQCNLGRRFKTNPKNLDVNKIPKRTRIRKVGKRDAQGPNITKGDPILLPKLRSIRRVQDEEKTGRNPPRRRVKSDGDRNRLDKNPRKSRKLIRKSKNLLRGTRKKKRCVFNKKKFKAGQTVLSIPKRCLDLVCVKESTKVSVIQAQFKPSCSCSDSGTGEGGDGGGGGGGGGGNGGTTGKCADYEDKFGSSHTMCKPRTTKCKISSERVTKTEKKKILKIHNEFRAKVANGKEKRGTPGPQPSASNMRELVWNDELEDVAQAWANTCPNGHDCNECRRVLGKTYFVGQNLYWSWSFSKSEEWDPAITAFYDEVVFVPNTLVDEYKSIFTASQIGHYTQLVWGETYEIGCGQINHGPCTESGISYQVCKTYVCNYGPTGNFLGLPIYKKGKAASDCPNGKSTSYKGLCK